MLHDVTHRWQSKEGDPQQSEAGGQQASRPRLRGFVPVADGRERDLRGRVQQEK